MAPHGTPGPATRRPAMHWEKYISISFHSEWDMIVATAFEPNGISIWFKNCHHDHIPFTVKGNGNIFFSVWPQPVTHAEGRPSGGTWGTTRGPWFGFLDIKFASNRFFVLECALNAVPYISSQNFGLLNFLINFNPTDYNLFICSTEFILVPLYFCLFSDFNLSTNPHVFP